MYAQILSLSLSLSRARARSLSHVKNVHFQVKHYEAIKVAVLVWLHVSLNHKPKPEHLNPKPKP